MQNSTLLRHKLSYHYRKHNAHINPLEFHSMFAANRKSIINSPIKVLVWCDWFRTKKSVIFSKQ